MRHTGSRSLRSRRTSGGRRLWVMSAVLTTAIPFTAAAGSQSDDEAALRALEREQAEAVVAQDFDALERIYADDFVFTHGTGEVHDTTQWLDALRAGREYLSREHETIEVELHGDLGVVYGVLLVHINNNGAEGRFRARYVRVYARRAGLWQLVSHRTVEQTQIG